MDDKIMITDYLDDLTPEQHLVIIGRALRRAGRPVRYNDQGRLLIDESVFDEGDEELELAWQEEAKLYVAKHLLERMAEDGDIRPDRVDANGQIIYVATDD